MLTDPLYRRMIANPDQRVPFVVNWPKVDALTSA
jgi:hypothetical protein